MRNHQSMDQMNQTGRETRHASENMSGIRFVYGGFSQEARRPFSLQFPLPPMADQNQSTPVGWLDRLMNQLEKLFCIHPHSERPIGISRLDRPVRQAPAMAEVPIGSPFFLRERRIDRDAFR